MDDLNKKLFSLSEISKAQLKKILNFIPGLKDLILESELIRPLERICGVSWLKQNGINKIFKLEPKAPNTQNTQVFMVFSQIKTFKTVVDLIQSQVNENTTCKYHIICIPKSLWVFENILEELGLYHSVVKLYSLQWFPISIDSALLSLEIPRMYKSLFIEQDYTLLPVYAKSLWHLFNTFGKPDFTLSLGKYSNIILKQLKAFPLDSNESEFGGMILMDRNIDYTSALLTPSTYTALLTEIYSVHCGVCEHKAKDTDKYDNKYNPISAKQPVQFPLDSVKDSIYREIKNRYFTVVTTVLSQLTKELRSTSESSKGMELDDMKKYVKTQLQEATSKKKNITNHLIAAETIINCLGNKFEHQIEVEHNILQNKQKSANFKYLEEILQTENDRYSCLKLMCLMLVTQKVSDSDCKHFLMKYFQEFGYDLGFLYTNLLKANFIGELHGNVVNIPSKMIKIPSIGGNNFYNNANKLRLIPNDPDKIELKNPSCCSYVFGGNYIPLISQIVSIIISCTPIDEIKNKLCNLGELNIDNKYYPLLKKTLLICVVGGITYSEVTALHLLEKLLGAKIIIISDKYISGKDIVDALITI